jgi:hypothetical protein
MNETPPKKSRAAYMRAWRQTEAGKAYVQRSRGQDAISKMTRRVKASRPAFRERRRLYMKKLRDRRAYRRIYMRRYRARQAETAPNAVTQ